jgi:hypothetical protein
MTPEQRVMRAKLASHTSWAEMPDPERRAQRTAAARRKSPVSFEYWLDKVTAENPDLPPKALHRAAENAHRAEMTRRALLSSQSRASKKTA